MEKYMALNLLFETVLRHLYRAEKAIRDNLVTLAEKAKATDLKSLFIKHKDETGQHISRIERIFSILGIEQGANKIQGMSGFAEQAKELLKSLADLNFTDRSKGLDGILSEGKELMRHFVGTDAGDLALTSAAQEVEHFEIASYNFLLQLGEKFENDEIVDLLKQSLEEEMDMDEHLSDVADEALEGLKLSHA